MKPEWLDSWLQEPDSGFMSKIKANEVTGYISALQSKLTQAEARIEALEKAGKALVESAPWSVASDHVMRCSRCARIRETQRLFMAEAHEPNCPWQAFTKLLNGGPDA